MTEVLSPAIETQRRAMAEDISLTRFLYVDHGGIVRGKAAATARLAERIESGIGHTRAMMAMSMMDELAGRPGQPRRERVGRVHADFPQDGDRGTRR